MTRENIVKRDILNFPVSIRLEHRIAFTEEAFFPDNTLLVELMRENASARPVRAVAFLDDGLCQAHPELAGSIIRYFDAHRDLITLALPPRLIPGGERAKRDTATFDAVIEDLHSARLCRHSYVIAAGGGAALDAACFAASVVHRGIRQIRIPTTVLAQADAGIGIKNGIDYRGKKNFLGAFHPPHAVINDFAFLRTLDPANWRNGMAEAVKVALLRDPEFFDWLERNADLLVGRNEAAMRRLIRGCAELHLGQIAFGGDPFERGSARPLDFGHWAAHRLEQLTDFALGHGHAVAIGMAIDCLYSREVGHLPVREESRIRACLERLGFELGIARRHGLDSQEAVRSVLKGLADFREHLGGELSVTLLSGIGKPFEISRLDEELLRACVSSVLYGSGR